MSARYAAADSTGTQLRRSYSSRKGGSAMNDSWLSHARAGAHGASPSLDAARNPATDRLAAIWQEAGRELGISVNVEERGGLSDGNLLWDAVPTLDGLGPWGDHDHCSERSADGSKLPEYVEVPSFVPKAALNTVAILNLLE